jgi:hypothetical protein
MSYQPSAISRYALCTVRYALYALLIFTPLARASVQGWAICVIHMVTIIALTAFLLEMNWNWNWKWISTPLDKPILYLLLLCLLSTVFSMHRYTSIWYFILLFNHFLFNHTPNPYKVPIPAACLSDYRCSHFSIHIRPFQNIWSQHLSLVELY